MISTLRTLCGAVPLLICMATWGVMATWTGEWRRSLVFSTVAVGVLIGVGTELLSVFHAVNVGGLIALYASYGAGLYLAGRGLRRSAHHSPTVQWRTLRDPWVAFVGLTSAILLLLAIVAPPNNWDSMTYHMARVAHWADQGDVSYYATHIDRQLFLQPWAEYAILHTYVLSDSDRWANLVQWAAMVVTLVAVTVIARNLGLSRRIQVTTAVIVLTLPMGITQSSTTQNDYVAAMWIAILATLVTDDGRLTPGPLTRGCGKAILIGTVAGLAAMTKGTTYFFIVPILLWWLLREVKLKPVAVGKAMLALALPALLLTAPGFLRNLDTYSRPFGPPLAEFVNNPVGPQATAENVVRHAVMQFGVPSDAVNQKLTQTARGAASVLGLNVDRAGSTFPRGHRYVVTFGYREDDAQAFAATVLLIAAVPALLLTHRRKRPAHWRPLVGILVCAASGVGLLETYFRWNPWNARYLLPFFVLTSLVSAAVMERYPSVVRRFALVALAASSTLWVFGSDLRPLARHDSALVTPRNDQYFAARPELQIPYVEATEYVRSMHPRRVGYTGNLDDWEYPLWVLLNKDARNVSLRSVKVTNASRRYQRPTPDIVICTKPCRAPSRAKRWSLRRFEPLSVWTKY